MAMSKECSINLKEHIIDLSQVSHFESLWFQSSYKTKIVFIMEKNKC